MWFCDLCKQSVDSVLKDLAKQQLETYKTIEQVSQRQTVTDELINNLSDKMDQILTKVGNGVNEKTVENLVEKKVTEYFNEQRDIEKRKLNLMLYRVPESDDRDVTRRIDYDHDQAERVFVTLKDDPGTTEFEFEHPRRIGKKEDGKVRPLRITLKVSADSQQIFRKSKDLAKLTDLNQEMDFVKNVSIAPDYTPKQRSERKKLLEELDIRRKNGEQGLRIFRNEIVRDRPGAGGRPPGTSRQ